MGRGPGQDVATLTRSSQLGSAGRGLRRKEGNDTKAKGSRSARRRRTRPPGGAPGRMDPDAGARGARSRGRAGQSVPNRPGLRGRGRGGGLTVPWRGRRP